MHPTDATGSTGSVVHLRAGEPATACTVDVEYAAETERAWRMIGMVADDVLYEVALDNPARTSFLKLRAECAARAGCPILPTLEVVR